MSNSHGRKPPLSALLTCVAHRMTHHRTFVSLHHLWRSAGSPEDRTPAIWLELAEDLLAGMVHYHDNLTEASWGPTGDDAESSIGDYLGLPVTWPFTPEAAEEMGDRLADAGTRPGDTLAIDDVAYLYALFLDGRGGHGASEIPAVSKGRMEPGETAILTFPTV